MGSGASAVDKAKGEWKDAAAITDGVKGLSAADKAVLKSALDASEGGSCTIAKNLKDISENEANLHTLHLAVMKNKAGVYEARSMIEENRANIFKNYSGCFVGNRQMTNQNTDDIFKNRVAILDALKTDGPVQENFRNSKYNEASIEFLENRSLLNNRVAKVNEKMSEVNADLIAINDKILEGNQEIVAFNAAQIQTNKNLLEGIQADKATPDANAARIAKNKETIAKIQERNDKYNAEMASKHAVIKENRTKLEENAAKIKERRKEIMANRESITANGAKVADLLRAGTANIEELTGKVGGLSDEEKASIKAALAEGEESAVVTSNRKKIAQNEAKLHEVHLDVMTNKEKLYAIRSIIEENRALVLKNYSSAFIGNRQMINQNTDDIFKNRTAILDAMKVDGQIQENFRNSKFNEAEVDFLEHRSKLNNRVAKVNEMMSAANTKLIDINSSIMAGNEEIVKFNAAQIETNSKLLEGILAEKATPEANEARIAENAKRIEVIVERCKKYDPKVAEMMQAAFTNRTKVEDNAKAIDARRDEIIENRSKIYDNGKKVMELMQA